MKSRKLAGWSGTCPNLGVGREAVKLLGPGQTSSRVCTLLHPSQVTPAKATILPGLPQNFLHSPISRLSLFQPPSRVVTPAGLVAIRCVRKGGSILLPVQLCHQLILLPHGGLKVPAHSYQLVRNQDSKEGRLGDPLLEQAA